MKGLVVTEDNKLYLEEKLPIPEIGEYEALVKNECCMICNGTDLGVIGGKVREVTRYPAVLGHEDAGRVVKIGKKVTSFKVGDLVVRAGQPDNEKFSSAWGGFAEYGIVKDYKAAMADQADVSWNYTAGVPGRNAGRSCFYADNFKGNIQCIKKNRR